MADEDVDLNNEEELDTTFPEMWTLAKPPTDIDDEDATEEQKKAARAAAGGPKVGKLIKFLNDIEDPEELEAKLQERDPATGQSLLSWATLTGKFVVVEWLVKKAKRSAFAFTNDNKEIAIFEKYVEIRKEIEEREREKLLNPPEEPEEPEEEDEDRAPEPTLDQQVYEALSEYHEDWGDNGPNVVKAVGELGVYQGHRDEAGTKNGLGQTLFPDGDMYTGEYVDNQRQGVGTYYWFQHATLYCGQWARNKRNGVGRMVFPDGARYFGAWSNDKINGVGRYTYPDGSSYNGSWVDGVKHGEGVYTFTDGSRYQGTFRNGRFVSGEWHLGNSGTRYVGRFENDKPVGKGIYIFQSAQGGTFRQEGEYSDGRWFPGALANRGALPSIDLVVQRKPITVMFTSECAALPADMLVRAVNFAPFQDWLRSIESNQNYFINELSIASIRTVSPTSFEIAEVTLKIVAVNAKGRRIPKTDAIVLRPPQERLLLVLTDGDRSMAVVEQTVDAASQASEFVRLPVIDTVGADQLGGRFLNVVSPALRVSVSRATTMELPLKLRHDASQGNAETRCLAYIQHVHADTITTAQARLDELQAEDIDGFTQIRAVRLEDVGTMSTDGVTIAASNYLYGLAVGGRMPSATAAPQRPPTPIPPSIEERPDIEPLLEAERAKKRALEAQQEDE